MFENSQFYIHFLKNFEIFHKLGEILILVKIFENFNFNDNFRKISISSTIDDKSLFWKKHSKNLDFSQNFLITSITAIMFEKSRFHINLKKKLPKFKLLRNWNFPRLLKDFSSFDILDNFD